MKRKKIFVLIILMLIIFVGLLSGIIYHHIKNENKTSTSDEDKITCGDAITRITKIDGWIINNTIDNISIYAFFISADLHISFDDIRIEIRSNDNGWSNVPIKHITTRPYPESYRTNNDTYFDTGEMVIIEVQDLQLEGDKEYELREVDPRTVGLIVTFKTMESFDKDGYVILYDRKKMAGG